MEIARVPQLELPSRVSSFLSARERRLFEPLASQWPGETHPRAAHWESHSTAFDLFRRRDALRGEGERIVLRLREAIVANHGGAARIEIGDVKAKCFCDAPTTVLREEYEIGCEALGENSRSLRRVRPQTAEQEA